MITAQQADEFARHWINAWNSHDIDAILEHYADNVEFYSPIIKALNVNDTGEIIGKSDLRAYFIKGLTAYPDLSFGLQNAYIGVNSIVIHYVSVNNRLASEVFEFDRSMRVIRVLCNYL